MSLYSEQKYTGVSQAGFALSVDVLSTADRIINASNTDTGIDGAFLNIFLNNIDAGNATSVYSTLAGYTGGSANGR